MRIGTYYSIALPISLLVIFAEEFTLKFGEVNQFLKEPKDGQTVFSENTVLRQVLEFFTFPEHLLFLTRNHDTFKPDNDNALELCPSRDQEFESKDFIRYNMPCMLPRLEFIDFNQPQKSKSIFKDDPKSFFIDVVADPVERQEHRYVESEELKFMSNSDEAHIHCVMEANKVTNEPYKIMLMSPFSTIQLKPWFSNKTLPQWQKHPLNKIYFDSFQQSDSPFEGMNFHDVYMGQCIYIPPHWWYQTQMERDSESQTLVVTYWYDVVSSWTKAVWTGFQNDIY